MPPAKGTGLSLRLSRAAADIEEPYIRAACNAFIAQLQDGSKGRPYIRALRGDA